MAHFAKLDNNNIVVSVEVINNDVLLVDGVESEQAGIDFLTSLYGHSNWKQTSYNKSFRKNYASEGFIYDQARDAFYPKQPFPSWVLDEDTCTWNAPTPTPEGDGLTPYKWDEESLSWIVQSPLLAEEEQEEPEESIAYPEVSN